MLRSIKDLIGYPVVALDGKAGKVVDVLFGDRHWRVRFLDVETRTGFHFNLHYLSSETGESVTATRFLVTPDMLGEPKMGMNRRMLPLNLKRDDLRNCLSFAQKRPIEEQYEAEFHRFFRHGIYDDRPLVGSLSGIFGYTPPVTAYEHSDKEVEEHLKRMKEIAGEHMHSAKAVLRYQARGSEESLGDVTDLILDVSDWTIVYFVLDTHHGIPSRKYLLSMDHVTELNWTQTSLGTKLTAADLEGQRRFWPYEPVNHDANNHDFDYYGKPCLKDLMEEIY